jgi:CheY-like chemotaxis protein
MQNKMAETTRGFSVHAPLREQIGATDQEGFGNNKSEKPPTKSRHGGALRIAIVDDVSSLVNMYSLALRTEGHEILATAETGEQLFASLDDNQVKEIDVAIVDYRLGNGMNGLTLANLLLQRNPKIKIVIASADELVRSDAKRRGLTVLTKPFKLSELRECISELAVEN